MESKVSRFSYSIETPFSFEAADFGHAMYNHLKPPSEPFRLGSLVAYAINANNADNIAAGVKIARKRDNCWLSSTRGHE